MTNLPDIEFAGLKAQYALIKHDISARVQKTLDHGQFIMGPEVRELETALADYVGCKHAIAVSSGTDALLACLLANNVGRGDAVFLPAFTFTATAEVAMLIGASPVFVDVHERNFNIDPIDLRRKIEGIKNEGQLSPRAVIAVDLFGLPADYGLLNEICNENGLFLLADAAQSFGASRDGRRVGTLAPMTATSFFPAKPLGCYGDGGAAFTDDDQLADRTRSIRAHGQGHEKYEIVRLGLNARLDSIQAAVLLAKLPHFEKEISARNALAELYDRRLGNLAVMPWREEGVKSTWAQYSILIDDRDHVAAELKARGVPTAVYYPRPLHMQPAYEAYGSGPGTLPVSESLCEKIISLPMHPYMPGDHSAYVCDTLDQVISGS